MENADADNHLIQVYKTPRLITREVAYVERRKAHDDASRGDLEYHEDEGSLISKRDTIN